MILSIRAQVKPCENFVRKIPPKNSALLFSEKSANSDRSEQATEAHVTVLPTADEKHSTAYLSAPIPLS